jgi:hypothetical protein
VHEYKNNVPEGGCGKEQAIKSFEDSKAFKAELDGDSVEQHCNAVLW